MIASSTMFTKDLVGHLFRNYNIEPKTFSTVFRIAKNLAYGRSLRKKFRILYFYQGKIVPDDSTKYDYIVGLGNTSDDMYASALSLICEYGIIERLHNSNFYISGEYVTNVMSYSQTHSGVPIAFMYICDRNILLKYE